MKVINGLGFPERGDFFKLLPYVIRGQDSGLIYAFCEILRRNHSVLTEFSRLDWLATDPMQVGKYITENFSATEAELSEFLADVAAGNANMDHPPEALRDVIHTLSQFRDLLTLLSSNVASGVPLHDFADSVARSVLKTARLRHQTRSSKWFAKNIGMLMGVGESDLVELWSDNTEQTLEVTPSQYPTVSDGESQVPQGDTRWDRWNPLSDTLERVTLIFDKVSADPADLSFANRIINDGNPWIEWTAAGIPSPGVYQFPVGSGKFQKIQVPDLFDNGVTTISPRWANASRYVEVIIASGGPQHFSVTITGPVSEVKFKSNVYRLGLFVNLMMSASVFEGSNEGLNFDALFRPLSLMMAEDFAPLTRVIDKISVGVGFRDQIDYAPHRFATLMVLPDENGTQWKVVLLPSSDDRPYFLIQPTPEEIVTSEEFGPIHQWDPVDGVFVLFGLEGVGETASLRLVRANDEPGSTESHTVFLDPWFLAVRGGVLFVGSMPLHPDQHLSGDPQEVLDLFGSIQEDNSTAGELMIEEQGHASPLVAFHDRPQDILTVKQGPATLTDPVGFPVGEGWVLDMALWGTHPDIGTDIRFRNPEITSDYLADNPEYWLANRNLTSEGFFRHGLISTGAAVKRVLGDGTLITATATPPGVGECDNLPSAPVVSVYGLTNPPTKGLLVSAGFDESTGGIESFSTDGEQSAPVSGHWVKLYYDGLATLEVFDDGLLTGTWQATQSVVDTDPSDWKLWSEVGWQPVAPATGVPHFSPTSERGFNPTQFDSYPPVSGVFRVGLSSSRSVTPLLVSPGLYSISWDGTAPSVLLLANDNGEYAMALVASSVSPTLEIYCNQDLVGDYTALQLSTYASGMGDKEVKIRLSNSQQSETVRTVVVEKLPTVQIDVTLNGLGQDESNRELEGTYVYYRYYNGKREFRRNDYAVRYNGIGWVFTKLLSPSFDFPRWEAAAGSEDMPDLADWSGSANVYATGTPSFQVVAIRILSDSEDLVVRERNTTVQSTTDGSLVMVFTSFVGDGESFSTMTVEANAISGPSYWAARRDKISANQEITGVTTIASFDGDSIEVFGSFKNAGSVEFESIDYQVLDAVQSEWNTTLKLDSVVPLGGTEEVFTASNRAIMGEFTTQLPPVAVHDTTLRTSSQLPVGTLLKIPGYYPEVWKTHTEPQVMGGLGNGTVTYGYQIRPVNITRTTRTTAATSNITVFGGRTNIARVSIEDLLPEDFLPDIRARVLSEALPSQVTISAGIEIDSVLILEEDAILPHSAVGSYQLEQWELRSNGEGWSLFLNGEAIFTNPSLLTTVPTEGWVATGTATGLEVTLGTLMCPISISKSFYSGEEFPLYQAVSIEETTPATVLRGRNITITQTASA